MVVQMCIRDRTPHNCLNRTRNSAKSWCSAPTGSVSYTHLGNLHSQADLGRVVIHQNNVSGLNSSVTSHGAHRDADIGAHQHGGVVDAITGKSQDIVLALGGQQLFYAVDFIGGQQLGMRCV